MSHASEQIVTDLHRLLEEEEEEEWFLETLSTRQGLVHRLEGT